MDADPENIFTGYESLCMLSAIMRAQKYDKYLLPISDFVEFIHCDKVTSKEHTNDGFSSRVYTFLCLLNREQAARIIVQKQKFDKNQFHVFRNYFLLKSSHFYCIFK